jgi:hypothetical protein
MMPRCRVVIFDNDKSRIAKTTFARRRSQKDDRHKKTCMAPSLFFRGSFEGRKEVLVRKGAKKIWASYIQERERER